MHQDIFLKIKSKLFVRINSRDIHHIEVNDHYSKVITATHTYCINIALSKLEALLPADLFCRVNRSFIIPLFHITRIEDDVVLVNNKEITIDKKYRDNLLQRLNVIG
jgi:DNA-binding LytR/AlgR family response regulator